MESRDNKARKIRTSITMNDYFQRLSKGYLMLFFLLPVVFLLLIFLNFRVIYRISLENIKNKAEATLFQYSAELDDFLQPAFVIMESMSYNVEDMFRTDADNSEIEEYLIRESENLDSMSDITSNGIYGFINGEYLDGYQWVPDEDYVPTERPWYKAALENGGEMAYVEPYIDSMTGARVMTISKLLSDGESVICIDVRMNEVQAIMESLVKKDDDTSQVMILDNSGVVIANSDPKEVGKNYLNNAEEPGATIAGALLKEGKTDFSIRTEGTSYIVYSHEFGGGWRLLSVTAERKMFAGIINAVGSSLLIGLIGTLVILYVLLMITDKRIESEKFIIDLKSASAIYLCMYKVDLETDGFVEISCLSDRIIKLVGERNMEARKVMKECVNDRVDERAVHEVLEFTDLGTIGDRLKDTDTLTCEFMNKEKVWSRARFIVAERAEDGKVKSVLFMVEVIDAEKKARDRLLYLSETDRMTGINNRGSGENKVRKQLLTGDGGMFILLDVDHFKSINDTFGHDVGDKVLIAVADCLKRAFRNNDIVMRLGGDEFAAYAPQVLDRSGGDIIVSRFLKLIEDISVDELKDHKVEISVGVAFYGRTDQFSFDELYKRADKCTYESKRQPGTRATFYEET